jgi:hypothetical protein
MSCGEFEDALSDYLEKALDRPTYRAAAEHAIECPLCHSLLNDVRQSISICHTMYEADPQLTRLEARILASTLPEAGLGCEEFEDHLTDYLDGFLPAYVFHRWERHAALCGDCSDLPGTVVRSLAAIVSMKLDELPVPDGLNERILLATTGTRYREEVRVSWGERFADWFRGLKVPISVPQLAPVAMMAMFAFLFISQSVSSDGSLTDIYSKTFQVAEQTYRQSAEAFGTARPAAQENR